MDQSLEHCFYTVLLFSVLLIFIHHCHITLIMPCLSLLFFVSRSGLDSQNLIIVNKLYLIGSNSNPLLSRLYSIVLESVLVHVLHVLWLHRPYHLKTMQNIKMAKTKNIVLKVSAHSSQTVSSRVYHTPIQEINNINKETLILQ